MDDYLRDLSVKVGLNIKALRHRKYPFRASQKTCAADFGVDPSYFVKWESGKILPSDSNQSKLARFFGVSVAELRGDVPMVLCPECRARDKIIASLEEDNRRLRRLLRL